MTNNLPKFDGDEFEFEFEVDEDEIDYRIEVDEDDYKSLAERRGVCSFDYNGSTIFVKADVEEVSRSLSEHHGTDRWHKNIVDREVELSHQCFFIFRLNGHNWTTIISRTSLGNEDARIISLSLKTRSIYYGVSDTALALGYSIYENGDLLEELETGECYENIEWKSSIHDTNIERINIDIGVEEWVDRLFRKNDVLEPSVTFVNFVGYIMHKPGHKVTIRDNEDTIERLDFVCA
jgi:hypothetical protein